MIDHLSLPLVNIDFYFSLGAKLWIRGGVGGKLSRNLNYSTKSFQSFFLAILCYLNEVWTYWNDS